MALSDNQIAQYARGAGLSGDAVSIAVAVALAESGGNPNAHNAVPPDNSYGLWQINMLGSLGPSRRSSLGISSNDALYDPATNARAMAMLSNKGASWTPWTTYTRGTYKLYLNRGKAAAGNVSSDPGTPQSTEDQRSGLAKLGALITDPAVYRKLGMYSVGAVLILIGFIGLVGVAGAGQALKAVKVVKAVKK